MFPYYILCALILAHCYCHLVKGAVLKPFEPLVKTRIIEHPITVWKTTLKNAHRNMCIVRCTSLDGCISVSVKSENNILTCEFFDKSPRSFWRPASHTYRSDSTWTSFVPPQGKFLPASHWRIWADF